MTHIYQNDNIIYMIKDEVTAFQLGSSTVITLPKELGIRPGQKMGVKKEKRRIVLREKKMTKEEVEKLVESLAGGLELKEDLTPFLTGLCSIPNFTNPVFSN